MKVLVAEDARGMRKLVSTMLQTMGFEEVIEAEDGAQAWEKLRAFEIDLLLTDWNMPVMNGIELVEKVRNSPAHDGLPILMFTARSTKEDVLQALQVGVDSYINNPFTPQQLKAKIQLVLTRRSRQHINLIFKYQDPLHREADHPLILFGQQAATPPQLGLADHKSAAQFLHNAVTGLRKVDERTEDFRIGYALAGDTGTIARQLRIFRHRVKMLVLSTDLPGGGVTLARLASINNPGSLAVFVVCDQLNELSAKERHGLERLEVGLFERHRVQAEDFEQLVAEHVVAPLRQGAPAELPPPEEIRRRIENDIRTMVSLPVLPQVYHQVVALDRDPESDIQDWVEVIEVDPLSRAQVIRRARSPLYGFQGEINETGKAVILLGKNAVKEIVVSGAVRRSFEGVVEESFNVEEYWLHSLGVALAARLLAFPLDEKLWTPQHRKDLEEFQLGEEAQQALKKLGIWEKLELTPQDDPFVGGMMHDIGKVALIQSYPGLFSLILEELKNQSWNVPMQTAEDLVAGGADHALVGRILAESWKLGGSLCRMVEQHHNPSADDDFTQLIALADLAGGCFYPYPKQGAYPMVHLLQNGSAALPVPAAGQEPSAESAPQPAVSLTPGEAVRAFLPPGLLERLNLPLGELIALGRLLAPVVHRLADNIRKSV